MRLVPCLPNIIRWPFGFGWSQGRSYRPACGTHSKPTGSIRTSRLLLNQRVTADGALGPTYRRGEVLGRQDPLDRIAKSSEKNLSFY